MSYKEVTFQIPEEEYESHKDELEESFNYGYQIGKLEGSRDNIPTRGTIIPDSFECFDEVHIFYLKENNYWKIDITSYDGGGNFKGSGITLTDAIINVLNKVGIVEQEEVE